MSFNLTSLEKLEALHAAAPRLGEGSVEVWSQAYGACRVAMDEAFPALAKALREAWVQSEDDRADARLSACMLDEIVELVGSGGDGSAKGSVEAMLYEMKERTEKQDAALREAVAQRDEARAEVERLRGVMAQIRSFAMTLPEGDDGECVTALCEIYNLLKKEKP